MRQFVTRVFYYLAVVILLYTILDVIAQNLPEPGTDPRTTASTGPEEAEATAPFPRASRRPCADDEVCLPYTILLERPRKEPTSAPLPGPTPSGTLAEPVNLSEQLDWVPSYSRAPAAGGAEMSISACRDVPAVDPGAAGWFVYPTGSRYVSGWFFHDPRLPSHIGVDYACALGDDIYAADSGIVVGKGWDSGYGNVIELDHGNGFHTRYGHFSRIVVECGQVVRQGDLVGTCGSTGWSTGPHLHFEIRYHDIPRDPMIYLPGSQARESVAAALPPGEGWYAEYYNNENLGGSPAITRYDSAIGFEWHTDSPAPDIPCDAFSARWTRRVLLDTVNYRFCAMSDDGARIWVGGQLVVDEWHANNGVAYCGEYAAWAGAHEIKVEYYEHGGEALIYVWWEQETTE